MPDACCVAKQARAPTETGSSGGGGGGAYMVELVKPLHPERTEGVAWGEEEELQGAA